MWPVGEEPPVVEPFLSFTPVGLLVMPSDRIQTEFRQNSDRIQTKFVEITKTCFVKVLQIGLMKSISANQIQVMIGTSRRGAAIRDSTRSGAIGRGVCITKQ